MTLFAGTDETATRAFDVMNSVMAVLVAAYEELEVDPPDRRYLWVGLPAVDCEQLVLCYRRIYTGVPGSESSDMAYCTPQRVLEMRVEVHRCVPVPGEGGEPPSTEEMGAASTQLLKDAWVVRRATEQFPAAVGQLHNVVAQEAIDAQGGFAGFSQTMGVGIP